MEYDFGVREGKEGDKYPDHLHVWIEDDKEALEIVETIIYQVKNRMYGNKEQDIHVWLYGKIFTGKDGT